MEITVKHITGMAEALLPYQIEFRRHLHRRPELSNEEFATTTLIKKELARHKIKIRPLHMKTGAVGLINPGRKPAVALRTDIDALPISERTHLPFRSEIEGRMHACGHDIHMAVVLGTAVILNRLREQIPGCVEILFQPAEEAPPGGAERLIREGVLDKPKVEIIFGLHVDPTLTTGRISLRDGPTMAAVIDFDLTIIGEGGHAAVPHRAVDAIAVTAEVIDSVQKIISREVNPMKSAVITFGKIKGGTTRNVIADRVQLSGTIRTLDPANTRHVPRLLKRTVSGICRARGARFQLDFLTGYPVLANHALVNHILEKTYIKLRGKKYIELTPPTMGGEDFSFYLEKVPGAMFRLGIKNKKIGADKPWHSPEFVADEKSIFHGTALLALAVLEYFKGT